MRFTNGYDGVPSSHSSLYKSLELNNDYKGATLSYDSSYSLMHFITGQEGLATSNCSLYRILNLNKG